MSSTIIQPVADHLTTMLRTIGLNVPTSGWARDHINPPAAEIEPPKIGRSDVDAAEDHFGQNDWDVDFKVTIWFNLAEATSAQVNLVAAVEAWIAAVDADPSLGGLVLEAKVTDSELVYALEPQRTLVGYVTTVQTLKFV